MALMKTPQAPLSGGLQGRSKRNMRQTTNQAPLSGGVSRKVQTEYETNSKPSPLVRGALRKGLCRILILKANS